MKSVNHPKIFWVNHANDCVPRWKNPGEAKLINHYLSDIIQKFGSEGIGIITAFKDQKKILIKEIKQEFNEINVDQILVDTIHGFKGIEKDVIFLSMVIGPSMLKLDYNYLKEMIKISVTRGKKEVYIFTHREDLEKRCDVFEDLSRWVKELSLES